MSDVPLSPAVGRSMRATTAATAARVDSRRMAMPTGWWGAALFIGTEATLFGVLFGTYFYLCFNTRQWPPAGVPKPEIAAPAILTGILVATTVPVFFGSRAARAGEVKLAWWLFLLAALVQGGFFGVQVHYFLSDLDKFSPQGSAYGSIYFTLLGAHQAHVALGLLLDLWVLWKLLFGLTNYRLIGVRVTAFYWYFVNAVAIGVLLTQLYPSL